MNEKEEIIKEAYEKDFGTAYEAYKIAVKRNPSIRLQDVKDYLNSRQDIQLNLNIRKYNSVVSSQPLFEFEIDLMDMINL